MAKFLLGALIIFSSYSVNAFEAMTFQCKKIVKPNEVLSVIANENYLNIYSNCQVLSNCKMRAFELSSIQDYPQFTKYTNLDDNTDSVYINTQFLNNKSMRSVIIGLVQDVNGEPIPHRCLKN